MAACQVVYFPWLHLSANIPDPCVYFSTKMAAAIHLFVTICWSLMSLHLHLFHYLNQIVFVLCFLRILSLTHLSVLIVFWFIEFYPSPGSWARWRCWRSVQSWWRGWWSPGPSARRGPTRFGYVKTGRGRRCWWMICCPATTMATSSSPRSGKEGGIWGEKWWMRKCFSKESWTAVDS